MKHFLFSSFSMREQVIDWLYIYSATIRQMHVSIYSSIFYNTGLSSETTYTTHFDLVIVLIKYLSQLFLKVPDREDKWFYFLSLFCCRTELYPLIIGKFWNYLQLIQSSQAAVNLCCLGKETGVSKLSCEHYYHCQKNKIVNA